MKKLLIILTIIITTSSCENGAHTDKKTETENGMVDSIIQAQVTLIDKVDTIELPPYCGTAKVEMTLKYKVLKVIIGDYGESTILIYHLCPREALENKSIKNDTTYNYKLKRRQITLLQNAPVDAGDYAIVK